jgi:hypothetical protein
VTDGDSRERVGILHKHSQTSGRRDAQPSKAKSRCMSLTTNSASKVDLSLIERRWVLFQMNVAALRPALGPLFNVCGRGRRAHTFYRGQQPPELAARASMGPTDGEPNGIPDTFGVMSEGAYSGRIASVAAASTILLLLDTAIQEFARELGMPGGLTMNAGDDLPYIAGSGPVKASTLIWAGANNVRHIDEWFARSASFSNPRDQRDRIIRARQEASMRPIAGALGASLPVVENVAYEVVHLLTMVSDMQGTYDRVELHVLRIGQDLVHRAGLADAPIGVTVVDVVPRAEIGTANITISDGIARSASTIEDVAHLFNVRPLDPGDLST